MAIAALAGVVLVRAGRDSGISALARAAGTFRPSEARLTGRFEYGPVAPIFRGPESEDRKPLKLRRVALETFERAEESPSAASLHAAGVGHLLIDDWDDSVATLRKASEFAPKDAGVWSDLAAALYTRSIRRGNAADLPPAHEAAARAVDLDGSLLPGRFNLALILDALGQRDAAKDAWKAYLERDPRSGWAEEARARLNALEAPPQSEQWKRKRPQLEAAAGAGDSAAVEAIVRRFPQQARQLVEDELLAGWATMPGPSGEVELAKAAVISRSLQRANGEGLAAEAADLIRHQPGESARLRAGHASFGEARRLYRAAEVDKALEAFRRAESEFDGTGSPFVHLARLGQASCHLYGSSDAVTESLVGAIEKAGSETGKPYRALLGQAFWLLGLIEGQKGHPYESLQAYERALAIFEALRESENVGGLHDLLAGGYELLGRPEDAWSHRVASLGLLDSGSAPARITNAQGEMVRASLDQGYPRLALVADDAEVRISESAGVPLFRSYSHLWRARTRERLGMPDRAAADLARARSESERITDPSTRGRARAEIDLEVVRLASLSSPQRALEAANKAIAFVRETQDHMYLPRLLLLRGRIHAARGSTDLARHDFEEGIEELEAARKSIEDEEYRISYFETARQLFDEALRLEASSGNRVGALLLADRAHAVAASASTPMESTAPRRNDSERLRLLQAALATSDALLEFWESESVSFLWVIRRTEMRMIQLPGQIEIDRALSKPRAGGGGSRQRRLYEMIFRPAEPALLGATAIFIVPDGRLSTTPVGSLYDGERRCYLAQRFPTTVLAHFGDVVATERYAHPAQPELRILIIADPSFDRSRFPSLPRLPDARSEAAAISLRFRDARVLQGEEATRTNVLRLLPLYDVIHIAAHVVANPAEPGLSVLPLAPDPATPNDSGLLYFRDVASLRLRPRALVFLSTCRGAGGPNRRLQGPLSVASAFLEAGAVDVVASSRAVDDAVARQIAEGFYSHVGSMSPAKALQQAQLSVPSNASESPSVESASFQLISTKEENHGT